MASIHIGFDVSVDADRAWQVIGDWHDGPIKMARGHVVSCESDGDIRVVTFAAGMVARERLIDSDDTTRRIVYSVIGDTTQLEHSNAVMQIVPGGAGRCRFNWTHDLLPDNLAAPMRAAMEGAAPIIKRTLESS